MFVLRAGLAALLSLCGIASAQGVASGNKSAAPRPKSSGLPFRASFHDVAAESGLTAEFVQGSPAKKQYIIEANGTGVAFIDYDNDGLLDVFLVNGSRVKLDPKQPGPTNHLYRNTGNGKFRNITKQAGVGRSGWGNGVCGGDFDNDGNEDLFVTYWGPNSLFRNKGDGSFEDVAARAGLAGQSEEWSTGCTFLDFDRDGNLDLLVASYARFSFSETPLPGKHPWCMFRDVPVFCGPRGLPYGTVTLFRNTGGGTFEDASEKAGIGKQRELYAFTTVAADFNQDGWTDIYVAADSTPSLYFRNNKDGTFSELGTEAGIAFNEHGTEQAGMGVALGDYNNDGFLDITKTNFIRDYPNLYRNSGKGFFDDDVLRAGMAVNPDFVLWGTGLEDFDNDGWRDVLQVAGHVYPEIQAIDPKEQYANPRLIYRNLGEGQFEDVSHMAGPGIAAKHSSRGAAFGDFDNDGDIDVLIMNMDAPPSLLRNNLAGENRWIKVKLQGTKSPRSAVGSSVTVQAGGAMQTAAVLSQSSFLSMNDPRLHFGVGKAGTVDKIVVRWTSGEVEEFRGASVNSLNLLVEGSGKARMVPLKK